MVLFVAAVGLSSAGCASGDADVASDAEESVSYAYPGEVCGSLEWAVVEQPAPVSADGGDDSYTDKSGHSGSVNCDRRLEASAGSGVAGSVLLDVQIAKDGKQAERQMKGLVPASPREVTDKFAANFEFAAEDASIYDNARYYVERGDPSLVGSWSQGAGIVVRDDNFSAACWFNYTVEPEPANSADLEGRMFKSVSLVLNEIRAVSKA